MKIMDLFAHVPKDHFKLPMKDLEPTGSSYYASEGKFYEEFRHRDNPGLRVIVDVDTNTIISVRVGKFHITI